jgi:hypothetical protein
MYQVNVPDRGCDQTRTFCPAAVPPSNFENNDLPDLRRKLAFMPLGPRSTSNIGPFELLSCSLSSANVAVSAPCADTVPTSCQSRAPTSPASALAMGKVSGNESQPGFGD